MKLIQPENEGEESQHTSNTESGTYQPHCSSSKRCSVLNRNLGHGEQQRPISCTVNSQKQHQDGRIFLHRDVEEKQHLR